MALFNSLGSNYSTRFALQSLRASNKQINAKLLTDLLETRYGGKATLLYKGREAIKLALRTIGETHASVGICGFTCFAVYDAVVTEDYDVVYLDIDNSLNFSVETLKKAQQKNPAMKVVIIQNTLGFACDVHAIAKFCKENNMILIEDLAHSLGTKYENGTEAGTIGDFVTLSFSQDKVVDGISGGALIIRNQKYKEKGLEKFLIDSSLNQHRKDRIYPLATWVIRKTYESGFGKLLHMLAKKLDVLSRPMDGSRNQILFKMPLWQAGLIYESFVKNDLVQNHRRKIAKIYAENLDKRLLERSILTKITNASNLRFPIFLDKREDLIKHLKQKNIYISDTWYDAPIGPKKYLIRTDYAGQCPQAEKIADRIVNLPTHSNVSISEAKRVVQEINTWLKLS